MKDCCKNKAKESSKKASKEEGISREDMLLYVAVGLAGVLLLLTFVQVTDVVNELRVDMPQMMQEQTQTDSAVPLARQPPSQPAMVGGC